MDTGGLAHMTYNMSFNNGGSLGVPGSGFASRGKGSHIKRLSVPHSSPGQPADDPHVRSRPAAAAAAAPSPASGGPRSSRSHLLAGLRTAPKQQSSTPATAPVASRMNGGGGGGGGGPAMHSAYSAFPAPQTAAARGFSNGNNNIDQNRSSFNNRQMYSLPEHVLAPPPVDFASDENGEPIDETLYSELVSANMYLAAQQQRLQQQLASVTAAAHQFQNMNLGMSPGMQQQGISPGMAQNPMGFYQQQAQQGMQPVVQAVAGQPGVYSVYNPMTGQQNYVVDDSVQEEQEFAHPQQPQNTQHTQHTQQIGKSPPPNQSAAFRAADYTRRPEQRRSPLQAQQQQSQRSPPATSPPSKQQQQTPSLATPASAGFNRTQKKPGSMAIKTGVDGARNAGPRTASFPLTPATGTFGPGQARAGEHPIRQPRGPPPLEELVAKPTSKHEGSKNFATRQRRRAVHNLVRAGMERRGGGGGQSSSGGSVTPSSDSDFNFSPTEGEDGGNQSVGSVSSHPSVGSLRGNNNNNNSNSGSEKKEKDMYSPTGVSGSYADEFNTTKANLPPTAADIVAGRNGAPNSPPDDGQFGQRRRMPMFVLTSAEKRRG